MRIKVPIIVLNVVFEKKKNVKNYIVVNAFILNKFSNFGEWLNNIIISGY